MNSQWPAIRRDLPMLSVWRQLPADPTQPGMKAPSANADRAQNGNSRLGYRRDIDGLRAVAVMAVLGYHLQVSWLSGGFVGVDIFFVISGYLIGSLILNEVQLGKFSLVGFYARRMRRIAPAFAAMALSILILSYFLLLPSEYVNLAWAELYSALSVSNIYFANHTGYFDAPASTQILLHTWSLGVEEQFYLCFPLLVLTVTRFVPKALTPTIAVLWVASFLLSVYGVYYEPQASFYLAPARAWELLLGTILARWSATTHLSHFTRNSISLLGLAMIACAIVTFTVETPFPGALALVPCLGTALIIAAGRSGGSLVASALSMPPVVFVGLISYSLYLWHWPIIFFQRSDSVLLSNGSRLLIVLYSFGIATLSWHFVERPFRQRFKAVPNGKIVAGGLLGLCSLAMVASAVLVTNGLPARFSPAAQAYASYLDSGQAHFREGTCFINPPRTFAEFDRELCLRQQRGIRNYLLIGDSHAAQLWYGLSTRLPGTHILQATSAGCRPEFTQAARGTTSCSSMMNYMFSDYLVRNHVDRLLVAARWVERDVAGLETVLGWAKDRAIPVTVFGPMVEYDAALPRILANAAQSGDATATDRHRIRNNLHLDDQLRAIASKYGATYVSYYRLLCGSDHCLSTTTAGSPLEFDTDHLTKQGSLLVAQKMVDAGQLN